MGPSVGPTVDPSVEIPTRFAQDFLNCASLTGKDNQDTWLVVK